MLRESRKQNLIMFGLPDASNPGVNLVELVVSKINTIDKKFTKDCILKVKRLGHDPVLGAEGPKLNPAGSTIQ